MDPQALEDGKYINALLDLADALDPENDLYANEQRVRSALRKIQAIEERSAEISEGL